MSSGGKSSSSVTVGYRYFAGLHLIFCQSVDALLKIRVGEKIAWEGEVTANSAITIDKPELFGGEDREGGVKGTVDACFGASDQVQNSYLQSILGASIPAFRGLFGLVARKCMLSANNPYPKEWSILARRSRIGWRDDLADIVAADGYVDMNPAHIIYDALTNTTWGGLGYPVADLDDDAFQDAANLLGAEGFGLSLVWAKNSSVEDFIGLILDHIDAVLYFSHVSGLLKLKLVRNDYNIGALPILSESNILNLVEYTNPSAAEVVNQVTVNYVDRDNQGQSVTVQDIAGIARMAGQVNGVTVNFVGIADPDLAAMVATRELTQRCMPLSSCTLEINRKNADLEPGDCFNFTYTPLGISDVAMRVTEVEIGMHTSESLRIKAVRDVFGLATAAFTTPSQSQWSRPENEPADAINRMVVEITWYQFVREYAGESDAVLAELDDTSTMVVAFCDRPSADAFNYEMCIRNSGATEWRMADTDSFPFVSTTAAAVVPEIASTIELTAAVIDTDLVKTGTYAMLENEIVAVTAVDVVNGTVTVDRGILDTIPVDHAAGAVIWFYQNYYGLDTEPRSSGESVEVKLLPSTSLGRLSIDDATLNSYTTSGRMMRPYPPGNVQVNGSRWPASIGATEELAITWAHRDRTLQTVTLNRQDEGNIGPEDGVTYTLRIYGNDDDLLRTETGLTGTGYTYAETDEKSDSGFDYLNERLRFELEAVRGSLTSFTTWNIEVTRPLPPANITLPVISGTAEVGETLTVSDGTWEYI